MKSIIIIMTVKSMKSFPLTAGASFSRFDLGNHVSTHGYAGPAHKSHLTIYGSEVFSRKRLGCLYTRVAEKRSSRKPICSRSHPYTLGLGQMAFWGRGPIRGSLLLSTG